MLVHDWRSIDAARMAPLYAAEVERWRKQLRWETEALWRSVEIARRAGQLSGRVATDLDGRVLGWTFFLLHRDQLQIGGVTAATSLVTELLLETVLESPEAAAAQRSMIFGYCEAPGLTEALENHGFAVDRYRYLISPVASGNDHVASAFRRKENFNYDNVGKVAELLSSAYPPIDQTRPFAPTGDGDEWTEYVAQLIFQTGVGEFDPTTTMCVEGATGEMNAVALVSKLAPGTAHLGQLVVRPHTQGKGLGRELLTAAMSRAGANGYRWMTLLVSEKNGPARRLYRRFGFSEAASFVSASCAQQGKSSNDASRKSSQMTSIA